MVERRGLVGTIRTSSEQAEAALEVWLLGPAQGECVTATVALVGELCTDSAPEAFRIVSPLCSTGGPVALDLGRITFMDCRGVTFLIDLDQHLQQQGARLLVVDASDVVHQLLGLADLAQIFLTGTGEVGGASPAGVPRAADRATH